MYLNLDYSSVGRIPTLIEDLKPYLSQKSFFK